MGRKGGNSAFKAKRRRGTAPNGDIPRSGDEQVPPDKTPRPAGEQRESSQR